MILNRLEFLLMNNPLRALVQRQFEARRLLRMGGPVTGGHVLEIGCGRGVGIELILSTFGAESVDAFDLDPRMVERARTRLNPKDSRVSLWVGDATSIRAPDGTYDAVFDFGILHHVPDWRKAVSEIHRVLKPNGVLYAEEPSKRLIVNPVANLFFKHPQTDRFDSATFARKMRTSGFEVEATKELWEMFAWFVARKHE